MQYIVMNILVAKLRLCSHETRTWHLSHNLLVEHCRSNNQHNYGAFFTTFGLSSSTLRDWITSQLATVPSFHVDGGYLETSLADNNPNRRVEPRTTVFLSVVDRSLNIGRNIEQSRFDSINCTGIRRTYTCTNF